VLFNKIAFLFEECIYILALEMAISGKKHCANCIGTLLFPIGLSRHRKPEVLLMTSLVL